MTLFDHLTIGILVLSLCLTSLAISLVPGVFENRFKYVLNIVLELYVAFVSSCFVLVSIFSDPDTQESIGTWMIIGFTVCSVLATIVSTAEMVTGWV